MNRQVDYFFPIKVWILTVLLATILFFLDLFYLADPPPRKFIPEFIIIILMIFWGLLTYSLPILLVLGAIMLATKKVIKNYAILKALLILVGGGLTLAAFLYLGVGLNWVTAACLIFQIAAGVVFKISKVRNPDDPAIEQQNSAR